MDAETAFQIMDAYKHAFEGANKKPAPSISYARGWFTIGNGTRRRKTQIEEMTTRLREQVFTTKQTGGE